MPPVALKKLIALQTAREAKIRSMLTRLLGKPKESLSKNIVQARLDAVKDVWAEVRKTHSEIIVKEDAETDAYVADSWFDRIQGVYENALDEILILLSFFDKTDADGGSSISDAGADSRVAKLPKIPTNLKLPVKHWDVWLIFLLSGHLDPESRKQWEAELSAKDQEIEAEDNGADSVHLNALPKFSDFIKFLEKRAQALSMVAEQRAEKRPASTSASGPPPRKVHHANFSHPFKIPKCSLCSGMHMLSKCYQLKNKNPHERLSAIKRLQLCFNCFGSHRVNACTFSGRCSNCNGKHHTLLHLNSPGNAQSAPQKSASAQGEKPRTNPPVVGLHAASAVPPRQKVILTVARVRVVGPRGNFTYVRALLDQGSEASFISESIVQLLGLEKERTNFPLSRIGASAAGTARLMTQVVLQSSLDANFELKTEALILPRLTSQLPTESINGINFEQFEGLSLADSEFFTPKKIDIILGADVYGQLLRPGLKRFPPSQLIAQNSVFGWVISGVAPAEHSRRAEQTTRFPAQVLHCATSTHELNQTLQRFWQLEDLPSASFKLKPDDEACERLFQETYTRDSQGKLKCGSR